MELAAFSLCLALCDALEPETIRASIKLFPSPRRKNAASLLLLPSEGDRLNQRANRPSDGKPPFHVQSQHTRGGAQLPAL